MSVDGDTQKPMCGESATQLGVRAKFPGMTLDKFDVTVDADGFVYPGGGMSATVEDPGDLPPHRRPKWLTIGKSKGKANGQLFVIVRDDVPDTLGVVRSGPEPRHYQIEPKAAMTYFVYRELLESTKEKWLIIRDQAALDQYIGRAA